MIWRHQVPTLLCSLAMCLVVLPACRSSEKAAIAREDVIDALPADGRRPEVLRFGATPTRGADTAEIFEPLMAYLAEQGIRGEVVVAADYDALADLMKNGVVDVGSFSPLAYVKARGTMPGLAIATATRNGSPTYLGYLVTRADDPADSLEALRGKRVAWVERSSTSGYLYARVLLRSKVADPGRFFGPELFAKNHAAVIGAVARGDADVGAVASVFIDPGVRERHPDADRLKVVAKTARIPLDCVVAHRELSRDVGRKFRDALLGLSRATNAAAALGKTWGVTGFVSADDKRYDAVADVLASEPVGDVPPADSSGGKAEEPAP